MSTLIIPILNSAITLLKGPALYLDDNTRVDRLTDEQFGLVSKCPPEYSQLITPEHRCIFVEIADPTLEDLDKSFPKLATKLRYTFNVRRAESPLLLSFAVLVTDTPNGGRGKKTHRLIVDNSTDNPLGTNQKTKFSFRPGTDRTMIAGFFRVTSAACAKSRKLYLTLGRYNSALVRDRDADKIIDLTISLESMVQDDKNELVFKFALFNAYASTRDHTKRFSAFELLKKLYNARSKIVHGGAQDDAKEQASIDEIMALWSDIEDYATRAINYQIFYMENNEPKTWMNHLLEQILSDVPSTLGASA